MNSATPLPLQAQGLGTTETKLPLAGVVVWWWWCRAAAAAAVACDVGTRTHKTCLCPGVARRTSLVKKSYVGPDRGSRRHGDRESGFENRNKLY